jgi:hypothetical protein
MMTGTPLTEEEIERIRELQEQGRSRNEIARELGHSPGTVTNHCPHVGLSFDRTQVIEANRARRADAETRRRELTENLLDDVERIRQRMWARYTWVQYVGPDGVRGCPDDRGTWVAVPSSGDGLVALGGDIRGGDMPFEGGAEFVGVHEAVAAASSGMYSSGHDEENRVILRSVSVVHERSALDRPVSLFEHAQRLHRLTPDGPLPDGGRPFPDSGDHPNVSYPERRLALAAVLREFIGDPTLSAQDLHDRCTHLAVKTGDVTRVLQELAPEPSQRLFETARWLIKNGTDRRAVLVGLGLLCGNAEQRDVPLIKVIGLLRFADQLAAEALAKIPSAARDLIWLAERSRRYPRVIAVRALAGHSDPVVREWVLSMPRDLLSSDLARHIAQGYGLAEMLGRTAVDDLQWDQAGNLLLAMTSTHNYQSEISRFEEAPDVYQRWVALADRRPATLERAALMTMVAEDLYTGPAAPAAGGLRMGLIDQIKNVLCSQPWTEMLGHCGCSSDPVEARRAAWIIKEAIRNGIPEGRFAVRVVVPDPNPVGFPQVEARIVIDGMPIVAAAFDKGPAEDPERLIYSGRLRATSEPQEIRLAEAYCTEGCCGGLYVTIVREGPEVVWTNWRSSMPGEPPQEVRFDAEEYDREVARAEQDHSWEWPARTVARLVADQLRADPAVLGRWDCAPGWCTAWLKDFDTARLTFTHPARRGSFDDPSVQFGLVVDVQGQAPQVLATEIIESMRNTDPKSIAEMIGGSKDGAEKLGLVYRKPSRW